MPTASITGSIDDAWQTALEDVGPAGVGQGQGRQIPHPAAGLQGARCRTATSRCRRRPTAAMRCCAPICKSGSEADVAKAVAYGKRVKVYPLSQAANPPATTFVDAIDVVFDSTIPYDLRFFQSLDRFVQHEPWLERDKVMIEHAEDRSASRRASRSSPMQRRKPF